MNYSTFRQIMANNMKQQPRTIRKTVPGQTLGLPHRNFRLIPDSARCTTHDLAIPKFTVVVSGGYVPCAPAGKPRLRAPARNALALDVPLLFLTVTVPLMITSFAKVTGPAGMAHTQHGILLKKGHPI